MHMPTLKQLKYFCAVVESKHFGRAAKSCYVSQSTLSSGVAELEEKLEVTLLERDNKGIRLTAIGREIHQRSMDILNSTGDLVSIASAAKEPFSTELRLGVIPTIAPFILPTMLSHIRNKHPSFKIYVKEYLSRHLIDNLHSGDLDLLLLALPFPADHVTTQHLFYDEFVLTCLPNYKLLKQKKLKVSDIKSEELLLLEDGHCIRDHALDACKMKADGLYSPYQATSLNTIIQMVANDMGVTILPKMAVDAKILRGTELSTKQFDEPHVWRSIGLMWRNKSPRQAEFRAMGQLILESL